MARPSPSAPSDGPIADADAIDQLLQAVREYQRQDQDAHETIIKAGDLDEATPWLNRTGWVRYLQGTPRQALFESTQRPADDAEGPERAILSIWEAMERLATVSQEITKACGHLLRIDVARTMKDESPHKPLLAYLDPAGIKKHVQPWQEIMMFLPHPGVFSIALIYHRWFCTRRPYILIPVPRLRIIGNPPSIGLPSGSSSGGMPYGAMPKPTPVAPIAPRTMNPSHLKYAPSRTHC